MTQRLPVTELEGKAAQAVRLARRQGELTVVTSRGEPVAIIGPAPDPQRQKWAEAGLDVCGDGRRFALPRRQVIPVDIAAQIIADRGR